MKQPEFERDALSSHATSKQDLRLPPLRESYTVIPLEQQKSLLNGVVRDGFFKDGLLAIKSSRLLERINDLFGDDFTALFGSGIYLSKNILSELDDKSKFVHQKVLTVLKEECGIDANRLIVVADKGSSDVIRHEMVHDVLYSRPREQREYVVEYIDSETFDRKIRFEMNYVGERHSGSMKGRLMDMYEFACKFFSGQWGYMSAGVYEEERARSAEYVRVNAPEKLKEMFYELGLIWPSASPKHL